jgi:hypothetical protein
MPTFDFFFWDQKTNSGTLAQSGPIIPVEVSMPRALEEFCTKKAIPIPAPKVGYALIDTGASITAIDENIFAAVKHFANRLYSFRNATR